ncbi:GDP-mannose 4,6-dehydratase [Francisella tularensis]|uniref:GDP-mannose 4,6-dehydratase n=1 Tax=Francisella tularensis TaxID=263 RepID=UPI0008F4CF20|nr:GDP-mannose 4,6-dehydratase [Francisella tularensis]APA83604.1 dTDP-glucose 4,6-dehydratase [Francisella tularensis subsp. novicida PA10-7858]
MIEKTVLVTGGAGFIGSHLVEKLLDLKCKVVCVDNFNDFYSLDIKLNNVLESVKKEGCLSNFDSKNEAINSLKSIVDSKNYILEYVDIRDMDELKQIFKRHSPDVVVNLAAMAGVRPSIENSQLYQDVNVNGFLNILEICKEFGIKKIVQASSSSVYGNRKEVPFKESDSVDFPISPYASSKKQCEVMSYPYYHLYDIDMIHLRFFTVYGPRQRPDLAIHKFTRLIDQGQEIPFFGDGSTKRDYTYIDDIIDGIIKSINLVISKDKLFDVFNLGESDTVSLKEMVEYIERALNKNALLKKLPMQPGDVGLTNAYIDKSILHLGYKPQTKFGDGIEKFVAWYKSKKKDLLK